MGSEIMQQEQPPIVYIVSDGLGESAAAITSAAAAQFSEIPCIIHRLPMVSSLGQATEFVEACLAASDDGIVLFHTLANSELRSQFEAYLKTRDVIAIDLIGPAINGIAKVTGRVPKEEPGLLRRTSEQYFQRIKAMDFAVEHDDARNIESLGEADIIIIGASRTSKTPLSIYLASLGYKVANIPLALGTEPPSQLFEVEPQRIFGLTSTVQLLSDIRFRHLGNATEVAGAYADPGYIQADLDEARQIMRRLGCIVVRTDGRSIEETAQEILRYYRLAYPLTEGPY